VTKTVVHLPSPRALARYALPNILESTIAPALFFYLMLVVLGAHGALFAALAWCYAAIGRRVVTGRRFPGILLIGAALLTTRTAISLATGSTFIYFLQPTLGTFLVALAFLVSVPLGKPLAERLARDFCPLDSSLLARDCVRRFFLRVSLLWTATMFVNAGLTLWMLMVWPIKSFVLLKMAVSLVVIGLGIVVSTLWFRRALHGDGLAVRWASFVGANVAEAA
jgi:hypothetical protein